MINLQANSELNIFKELSTPEDDIKIPMMAMIMMYSSIPYIFRRPYRSARKPKVTCPTDAPSNVAQRSNVSVPDDIS